MNSISFTLRSSFSYRRLAGFALFFASAGMISVVALAATSESHTGSRSAVLTLASVGNAGELGEADKAADIPIAVSRQFPDSGKPAELLGLYREDDRLHVEVVSTGCTAARDFVLVTDMQQKIPHLTLWRLRPDRCRKRAERLSFSLLPGAALSQQGVHVSNPFITLERQAKRR